MKFKEGKYLIDGLSYIVQPKGRGITLTKHNPQNASHCIYGFCKVERSFDYLERKGAIKL